jgi:opacity protein-like surface antigen
MRRFDRVAEGAARGLAGLALAAMLATAAAPAQAAASGPDAAAITAFLNGIYAHYRSSKMDWTAYMAPNDAAVFDPALVTALRADQQANQTEDSTYAGVDIFCLCQEHSTLKVTIVVDSVTGAQAKAHATVSDTMGGPRSLRFDLVKVGAAWRVYDVFSGDSKGLRQLVMEDLKAHQPHP